MEGTTSLPILFFNWWYGYAYRRLFKYLRAIFIYIYDLFSVRLSLITLFAPWKRDSISYEGLSLQQKFEVWTLNLASRFVGFIVKTMNLVIYTGMTTLAAVFSLGAVIVWPLYPVVIVYFLYLGIKTLM